MPTNLQTTLVLVMSCSAAWAQSPVWREHTTTATQQAVNGSAMACDHLRNRVVLFGGGNGFLVYNFTAELDGETWTFRNPATVPPARLGHSMAFDERRGEVVMFGGATLGMVFTGTWIWDGTNWEQRFPQHTPPGTYFGSLTYDEARERCVLFTGHETWEWDGTDWLQKTPANSPPSRMSHAAAYDSWRQRVVLFGGSQRNDTWEWDGIDWQQIATTASPTTGFSPQLAFDRERGRCVMVRHSICYEYDGLTWTPVAAQSGAPDGLVYDRQRGRMVCYNGLDGTHGPDDGKTWSLEAPTLALAQPYGVGCGNPPLTARENAAARPLLGNTLSVDIENVPTGLAFMAVGWSSSQLFGVPLPLSMAGLQLPGCWWLQSGELISLPCVPTGATTASYSLQIPSSSAFLSQPLYLQPWAPAPGLNPANSATGNGLAVRIGAW